jgi:putative ABC transport system permease protein
MPSARFPADREELDAFVAGWPAARGQMERLESGWKKAAARVRAAQGGRLAMECLADGGGAFGEAVRAAGFRFSPAEARAVAARAERLLDEAWMERALDGRAVRQTVARHFNVLPGDVTAARMWTFATRPDRAGEYLRVAGDHQGAPPTRLTPERAADLAQERLAVERMEAAQRLTAGVTGGWMGLGQRMGWLLAVSMLVCGIGIANAMLMTVTERFREIATLKCLGALDGFIMLMFVLESCLLGLIGGVSGGVLGGLLGLGRMALVFGVSLGGAVPLTELGVGLVAAVASGIALAGAASVYPSFRAARLAPMEAMRVE